MNNFKRFLSLALAVLMTLSYAPTIAYATDFDSAIDLETVEEVVPAEDEVVDTSPDSVIGSDSTEEGGLVKEEIGDTVDPMAITVSVTSEQDIIYFINNSGYGNVLTIGENITIENTIVVNRDLTIDLNGKTLTGENVYPVIRVQGDANVIIKDSMGEGGITNSSDYVFVLGASDGSSAGNLTIESGTYVGNTTVASVTKGTLTINGGTFSVTESEYGATYLLNCIDANYDAGTAKIVVNGGTFENFNPADNAAEGTGTSFVAAGSFVTVDGNDNYVVEAFDNEINSKEELIFFAEKVNSGETFEGKTVKLGADIDLTGINWTPIGNGTNYFWGTFDGQNKTISNMTINIESEGNVYAGLFGGVRKATVKNLKMTNVTIDAVGARVYVGAVFGLAHSNSENHTTANLNFEDITVDGCTINAESKSGSAYVGGLSGYCYPANMTNITVSNLTLNPKATGTSFVGGLVGYMQGQNISNNGNTRAYYTVDTCNLSNIIINAETVSVLAGGFAGYTYYGYITMKNFTIEGFKADITGTTTSDVCVGGLVGLAHRSDKGHTFTDVEITDIDFAVDNGKGSNTAVGGVVGYSGSPIAYSDCAVSGTITEKCTTTDAMTGGFVGGAVSYAQSFTNCVADVDVTGSDVAGGFVGYNYTTATYTNCEAKGTVEAKTAGGFAGYVNNGDYTNCKYTGESDVEFFGSIAAGKIAVEDENGVVTVKSITTYKVATKDELNAALAAAANGDIILFTADIDYGTDQLKVEKAITLDLGGYTLTTRNAYGGMSLKNNPTIKNGTIVHASNTAAIKVWNASFEDLVIDVQGKGDANKTIGGIVLQSGSTTRVDSIKNVTIKGDALTNGIETYNCGDATQNVIGSMENVTIDAVGTGMLISAPCGTATNCSIKGGVSGIDMLLKGTYSVSLDLVDCDVTGGKQAVYAHDEQKGYTYVGSISLTADEDTTFASENDVLLTELTEDETSVTLPAALTDGAVAKVNGAYYKSFKDAVTAANAVEGGATVTLLADCAENVTIKQVEGINITIDGNGYKYSGTITIHGNARYTGAETLTIKNVSFVTSEASHYFIDSNSTASAERYAHNVTVDGCTFTATGAAENTAVAMRIRQGFNITVKNSTANGLHSLLQAYGNSGITIDTVTVNGKNGISLGTSFGVVISGCEITAAGYGIRADGDGAYDATITSCTISANDPVVVRKATGAYELTLTGTNTLTARNEKGYQVTFTAGNDGEYEKPTGEFEFNCEDENIKVYPTSAYVATVNEERYLTLAEAVAAAQNGDTIILLDDVTLTEALIVPAGKTITLDLNGKTVSYTSSVAGEDMITNRGNLTITDSTDAKAGKLTYTNTDNTGSNVTVSTISTEPGSVLTVKAGTIENKTVIADNASYPYAIDILTNGNLGDVTVNIEGGTVYSDYMAIRQFNNGEVCKNTLNVTGGYIYGAKRAIQIHFKNNAAYTTISDGTVEGGDYSLCFLTTSENVSVTGGEFIGGVWYSGTKGFITGGTFTQDVSAWLAPDYGLAYNEKTGTYSLTEDLYEYNGTAYKTLAAVIAAIKTSGVATASTESTVPVVEVIANHKVDETTVVDINLVLNLNGKTITTAATEAGTYVDAFTILADVTVTGGGTIDARPSHGYTFYVGDNEGNAGTLTIENGTFYGETSVVNNRLGTVTINGGNFAVSLENEDDDYRYTLNCIDANYADGSAKIVVTGGTFTNFNPADNAAEGANTNFCSDNYIAEELETGKWTVRVANFVAEVNGVEYESIAEAAAAAEAGNTILVFADHEISEPAVIEKDVIIDLGGKSITTSGDVYPVIRVQGGANVTVKDSVGEGTITNDDYVFVLGASDGSSAGNLTIESGTYVGNTTVASVTKGTLTINGGTFSVTGSEYGATYLLNCIDANYADGSAKIVVKGGTFTGFNPANNAAEGTNTNFVAVGSFVTVDSNGNYVVEAFDNEINSKAELIAFAELANRGNNFSGKTVTLAADIDLGGMTWTPINSFAGTFDGGNYTISNFKLDGTNGQAAFFKSLGQYPATVKNLTLSDIEGTAGSERFAILAATGHTSIITNVHIKNAKVTTIHKDAKVGAIYGYFNWTSASNCTIENFEVDATNGAMFIGGFAGWMDQDLTMDNVDINGFKVTVSDTDNDCAVGGFTAQTQTGHRQPTFSNCDITGLDVTATGTVYVGGFIAWPGAHTIVNKCTVAGKIDATGITSGAAGGFLADYGWNNNESSKGGHKIANCSADVDIITKVAPAGGFVGSATNSNNRNMPATLTNCTASGEITLAEGGTANIGGFAGEADRGTYDNCSAAQEPFIGFVAEGSTLTNKNSYIASVDSTYYASLDSALAAAKASDSKTLVLLAPVVLTEDTTLDLTDIKVDGNGVYPAFRIQNGANVTVKGGEITNSDYVFVLGASDGSSAGNLTIESGTYVGNTTVASVTKGTLTITGGNFSVTESDYGATYLLNCIDANYADGSAKIVVTGGTFESFNPADNAAEGTGTSFVADGYVSETTDDGATYTVRKANYVAEVNGVEYESIQAAISSVEKGATATVTIIADHTDTTFKTILDGQYSMNVYVANGRQITLNLNGHNVHFVQDTTAPYASVFFTAFGGASLTIIGEGEITYTANTITQDRIYLFWANSGTTINIKNGSYSTGTDDTIYSHMVYASGTGAVKISGGTFINNVVDNTENEYDLKDIINTSGTATITVTGGTFNEDLAKDSEIVFDGYAPIYNGDGTWTVEVTLPKVAITDIKDQLTDSDPDLTFALNFAIDGIEELSEEYIEDLMAKYGSYYTDYVLTISDLSVESVTFNANGKADGYLAGQYDVFGENWVSVPFSDVTIENGESLYIMEYAASLMNQSGLRYTLAEIAAIVQNFDCGVYFTPEFLAANPNMEVTLELKVFTEDAEGNKINDISVATNDFDVSDFAAIVTAEGKQTKYYGNFGDAYTAAVEGDTIELLKDVTLTGKLTVNKAITIDGNGHSIIANHKAFILETNSDCTFKDITLNTNSKAKGVKITSGNVVFDNVTIPNSNNSDAITVNGTLTLKNRFTAESTYTVIDARSGIVNAEAGTVFDITNWRANVSPANSDLKGAVDAEGNSFFCAYSSTAYYKTLSTTTSTTNLTLLADVELSNNLTVSGTLDLNGHSLTFVDNKALKVSGALEITGGSIDCEIVLTNKSATLTAPEGLNVTTTVDGYIVVYENGIYYTALAVAQVGETKYKSLKEALEACTNGETVTLLTDITYDTDDIVYAHGGATGFGKYDHYNPSIIYVGGTKGATAAENQPSNVNAVIDLNGHTITNNADAYLFLIMDNAKVTFTDSSDAKTGAVIGNNESYPVIWVCGTDTLVTIEAGLYQTNSPYGVLHSTHAGDLVITDGEFKTTTTDELGGKLLIMLNSQLYNNPNYFLVGVATVTIYGGTFHDFNPAEVGDDYGASSIEEISFVDGCADGYIPVENSDDGTYGVKEGYYKVQIKDGKKFETLAEAIAAATSGDTIVLLADIEENVTVDKNLTIDGAGKNYTGTMTLNKVNVTIQNVNFVKGNVYKHKSTGVGGTYTIKDCTFDGQGFNGYAVNLGGTNTIVIENVTAKNYGYGFLQVPSSNDSVSVKNVEVNNVNYGFKIDYSNGVTLENVDITASVAAVLNSNYGPKTITIKNSKLSIFETWSRNKTTTTTILFAGENTVGQFIVDETIDVFKLADKSVLIAPNDIIVTTDVENSVVVYKDDAYRIAAAVAQNTTTYELYTTVQEALAEAKAGETVTVLAEAKESILTVPANVTLDLNGNIVTVEIAVLSFGDVIDSEEAGGIKISNDVTKAHTYLQAGNTYLPIYDSANGVYRFFAYSVKAYGYQDVKNSSDVVIEGAQKFGFRILFTGTNSLAAYTLLSDSENVVHSDIIIKATLSWTNMKNPSLEFTFSANLVADYAMKRVDGKNSTFTLTITGLNKLTSGTEVTIIPSVETVPGVKSQEVVDVSKTVYTVK